MASNDNIHRLILEAELIDRAEALKPTIVPPTRRRPKKSPEKAVNAGIRETPEV